MNMGIRHNCLGKIGLQSRDIRPEHHNCNEKLSLHNLRESMGFLDIRGEVRKLRFYP
jgi:hypothetical protein